MKFSTEFKRMQQLAGIQLNEIKVNNPLDRILGNLTNYSYIY